MKKDDPRSVRLTAQVLKRGDIAVIPTDTIYGLSGIVPETEEAIRRIKGREETKPFIRLIGKPEDLFLYTDDSVPGGLLSLWPAAVSIIVNTGNVTTAFRCPADRWLRSVLIETGCPVYSTSVNRAGKAPLWRVGQVEAAFGGDAAIIVDDGDKPDSLPSTVVDVSAGGCRIVRQGSVVIPASLLR